MQTSDEDEEESRRQIQMLSAFIDTMINIIPLLPAPKKKRKKRIAKVDLPYHKRRRRVNWHQWVRELGPEDFYRHHRMTRDQFEKLLTCVRGEIARDVKKCRYGSGPVTPRMQLTITLKHLGGDSTHDIEKHMGGTTFCVVIIDNDCSEIHTLHICIVTVARTTVSKILSLVLDVIVDKLGIPPFPLDDPEKLEEIVTDFRSKSILW